jgi:hypothetical protein
MHKRLSSVYYNERLFREKRKRRSVVACIAISQLEPRDVSAPAVVCFATTGQLQFTRKKRCMTVTKGYKKGYKIGDQPGFTI